MKTTTDKKRHINKIAVVCDEALQAEVMRHRDHLRGLTGLQVSVSSAAVSLLRAGLAASRPVPSR